LYNHLKEQKMLTEFEAAFKSLPVDKWKIEQVIILDWYDGPRSGFCKTLQPSVSFYFEVVADCYSQDDTDDHLFQLSDCPTEKLDVVIEIFAKVGQPQKPSWIPSGNISLDNENQIERIIFELEQSSIIVQSHNMIHFSRCWVKSR